MRFDYSIQNRCLALFTDCNTVIRYAVPPMPSPWRVWAADKEKVIASLLCLPIKSSSRIDTTYALYCLIFEKTFFEPVDSDIFRFFVSSTYVA